MRIPSWAKLTRPLGKLLLQGNHPEDAAVELRRALDEDPEDRVALNQYILTMKRINRIEEANAAALRLRGFWARTPGGGPQESGASDPAFGFSPMILSRRARWRLWRCVRR